MKRNGIRLLIFKTTNGMWCLEAISPTRKPTFRVIPSAKTNSRTQNASSRSIPVILGMLIGPLLSGIQSPPPRHIRFLVYILAFVVVVCNMDLTD